MERKRKPNAVVDISLEFAVSLIVFCEMLKRERKYIIARQLLRSGTSIGANIRESQQAESKPDFIHKLKIALKEVEETDYWLLLCKLAEGYPDPSELSAKLAQIRSLLIASRV